MAHQMKERSHNYDSGTSTHQLPNGDFELTACSYLSTTGANVDLMRGASRIKLDIANNSTMAMAEDFVKEMVKKSLEGPDKGQPMLIAF